MSEPLDVSLARVETKIDAIHNRLDDLAREAERHRGTKTDVAVLSQTSKVHSRLFWGLGAGFSALFLERLRSLF